MPVLPAPRQVSPLIRVTRWSLLVAGVTYGFFRNNFLQTREIKIKEHEDKVREMRAIRLAGEKAINDVAELNKLAEDIGIENRIK